MVNEVGDDLFMNGQKVVLKNPGTQGLADFLKLARSMSKVPQPKNKKEEEEAGSRFMEYLDNEAIDASVSLINLTLEKTFPDMDKDEREEWGMENAMLILPKVIEMCSPKQTRDQDKRVELSEKIKTLSGK